MVLLALPTMLMARLLSIRICCKARANAAMLVCMFCRRWATCLWMLARRCTSMATSGKTGIMPYTALLGPTTYMRDTSCCIHIANHPCNRLCFREAVVVNVSGAHMQPLLSQSLQHILLCSALQHGQHFSMAVRRQQWTWRSVHRLRLE